MLMFTVIPEITEEGKLKNTKLKLTNSKSK